MANQNATIQQLIDTLTQQQQLVQQLLTHQTQNLAGQAIAPTTIPALPDIMAFEQNDDKSRVSEWISRFKFALDCAAPNAADGIKVKALMNKLSEAAFSEYSRSVLPSAVTDFNFDATVQRMEKLFARPQSVFIDRYECLKAVRSEGEDFRSFINRHRKLLADFKFSELNKEQFNCLMLLTALKSHSDSALRQRILAKLSADGTNITYDGVVEDLINFQATIVEAKAIEAPTNWRNVNAVNRPVKQNNAPKMQVAKVPENRQANKNCWRCGATDHWGSECRFIGAKCRKCKFTGHIERQCESVQQWRLKNKGKRFGNKRIGQLQIGMVNPKNDTDSLKTKIRFNKKPIQFALDTGSDVNVIDVDSHVEAGSPPIEKCTEIGRAFDGTPIRFIGKGFGTFEFGGILIENEPFYVAKRGSLNLLSRQTMGKFGFLDGIKQRISEHGINSCRATNQFEKHISELRKEFPNVFEDALGHYIKEKAHLELKGGAAPIYRKARPVPHHSKDVIERELDRLEGLGIIRKVEHLDWAAPILVVKKADGNARLCIDYSTGLNDALIDYQHPLPIPEDIFATLNGGQFFSQIDLKDAYFQVELDEDSKKLCGLSTHKGNFAMERLPFGVKSAPSIFQSIMDKMLAGLNFATAYLDDIIVASRSFTDHIQHLKDVFNRLQSYGFRVKMTKCSFFQEEIKYLGFVIDKNGRRPDASKIKAITEMPAPTNLSTLRSFLGMVNHYQQFVQNMRFVRKPLDDLLKKDAEWIWAENCRKAFDKLKEILTSNLLLTHYDPNLEIIVSADASEHGIGAVIAHRFPDGAIKAIAHASKSLNAAEKNYAQIEKEGLALIFAVQKFHKMIYGRKFVLQTDHKPLLAIFGNKKGIRQCSANRLIRWSLILLAYDFEIEYLNTKDFGHADALSRLIAKGSDDEDERVIASVTEESEMEDLLKLATKNLPIKFHDLVLATKNDALLKKVVQFVQKGWPNDKDLSKEEEILRLFHRRMADLSILKDCLMYGERVVIPKIFQSKILHLFHKGHPGMKRMKQLARQYVFWPKMDQNIEQFVQNCEPCQAAAKAPVKSNLHSWPKSTEPWQRIHIDYAGPFYGKMFLIVVDSFSKYPEVFEMTTSSATATIDKLRYLFTRHGIPETIVSDNGTQFSSSEFAKFTAANGITHLFSAPYNPMSNGQAERFVDTFKRAFRKLKGEGMPNQEIIETFLITYRTTPNDSLPNSVSPAEMLLGRKPRTTFDLLKPPPFRPLIRDLAMEERFNKRFGTKSRKFEIGDKIFARHRSSENWRLGVIKGCSGVIFEVKFMDGSKSRFHANQLRNRQNSNNGDEALAILNDAFALPLPPAQANEVPRAAPPADQQEGNGLEDQGIVRSPLIADRNQRRYPHRQRRAPDRYSPS